MIATVDKFAQMPWNGATQIWLGRKPAAAKKALKRRVIGVAFMVGSCVCR